MRIFSVIIILFSILLLFQNCTNGFESAGYVDHLYSEIGNSPDYLREGDPDNPPKNIKRPLQSDLNISLPPSLNFSSLSKNLYITEGPNHIRSGSLTSQGSTCVQPVNEVNPYYSGRITRFEFHNIIEDVFGVLEEFGGVQPLHKMSETITSNITPIIGDSTLNPQSNQYKEIYENNRQDRLSAFTDRKSELAKIISNYPEQNEENYYKEMNRLNLEYDFVSNMLNIGYDLGVLIVRRLGSRDNKSFPGYIKNLGCPQKVENKECLTALVHKVIPLLWRKKITPDEIDNLIVFTRNANSVEDVQKNFIKIIQLAIASPQFYIKRSLAASHAVSGTNKVIELTNTEQASRLAFYLTSSVPDPILLNDAISSGANFRLKHHVDRLLAKEKTQKRFTRTFFGSVLNISNTLKDTSIFDVKKYNGGQIQYRTHYYAHKILSDLNGYFNKPLSSLITDKKIIGNHALWINSFNTEEESSIIRRGIYVFERLLCGETLEPTSSLLEEIAVVFKQAKEENKTNRQVLEDHLNISTSCASCHVQFDPLGVPYEKFNAFGNYREFCHGEVGNEEKRIRTDTALGYSQQIKVNNDIELERNIASSIDLKSCMTNHLTNKFSRLESKDPLPCSIGYSLNTNENPTLKDMIKNTVNSPLFKVVLPVEEY